MLQCFYRKEINTFNILTFIQKRADKKETQGCVQVRKDFNKCV